MKHSLPKSVVLIAGPTASGKSALAMALAEAENGVIINADSMQVYSGLRILTARPTVEDEARLPHLLYGHRDPAADYSTGLWQKEAVAAIKATVALGKLPIICGGTGLYFMSLLKGLAEVPEISPEVRAKWRNCSGDLHAELAKRDPVSAAKLNPADRQRLIRALEVVESTGTSLPAWQTKAEATAPLKDWIVLYARADARFEIMLGQGALDEMRHLPKLNASQPLMKAIGVPELGAHLRGEISLDEARTKAQTATRQYIKRQLTWWRGQMQGWEEIGA
jgi:tRNA dimethylallyltransferase